MYLLNNLTSRRALCACQASYHERPSGRSTPPSIRFGGQAAQAAPRYLLGYILYVPTNTGWDGWHPPIAGWQGSRQPTRPGDLATTESPITRLHVIPSGALLPRLAPVNIHRTSPNGNALQLLSVVYLCSGSALLWLPDNDTTATRSVGVLFLLCFLSHSPLCMLRAPRS